MAQSDETEPHMSLDRSKSSSSFAVDTLRLAVGATLSQAIVILAAPILSRLFAPEAFGTAAVFGSIVQIIAVVVCLRYELAIMLPEEDEDAGGLLAGSLFFVGVFTLLTALTTLLLGRTVVQWLKAPGLEPFLWLLPIAVLASGIQLALRYWNTRAKRFGTLARVRVAGSVTQTTSKLGAGLAGYTGAGSLIGGTVLGYVIAATGLGWTTWREDRHILLRTGPDKIVGQLKRYRKFPLVSTWSGLLNTLSLQLPIILLSAFFSQTVVGYFSYATRMIGLPMTLVGNAIGQVFFQRAAEAKQQGNLDALVQNSYERLMSLGLYPMLVLGVIGPELFVLVFGPEWAEAGVYAQITSLWRFCVFVGSPMSTLFSVLERLGTGLVFNVFLLVTRVLSLAIGAWLGSVRWALALYAGTGLVIWIGLVLWLLYASGASVQIAALSTARRFLIAAPILGILVAAKLWWQWPPLGLVLLAGGGAIFYYGIVVRQDRSLANTITKAMRRMRNLKV